MGIQIFDSNNNLALSSETFQKLDSRSLAEESKLFISNFELNTIGLSEIPIMLFKNPTGSLKTIRLERLTISNFGSVSSVIRVRAYTQPTITADGSALTISCTNIGGAVSVSQTFLSPTISANGTKFLQLALAAFQNTLIIQLDSLFILPENTNILLTAQAEALNRTITGSLIWAEI